ncbi:SDR family oxidoreductase [Companilactobacillus sp.]|jgi:NADP-dependent 3-hydroxy acid dehydrogenase YdfG|uniref:SDR family oxidoreductase n=1 Tax=Companilactobacillus sp. TaxID=2767905 RepID=UPI0025B7F728|nr:SDR family oxidoreductase [Companilactobacillus sp.]MCH4009810.1 SDR family oxidoreductase [Companilactobacillus sp.]MCH4052514.1 SDR family oxidoreductase [Companilactobacillus sp.]MCH4077752.1 SDR family oxidoreductase [Companilactobacillus sp.]MCH4126328.1 SDR family oxidoreductase [Companilactobacillus sp.]MCI1312036.1 SDR family oxidoreductase [Companilactobacillus sp.]
MTEDKKVIVITGASSGIGENTAKLLASQGNELVLGARRENRLKEIVKDIEDAGGSAIYQVTDVTVLTDVQQLADAAIEKYGRIDVWMNNAGLMPRSELIKGRVDEWDKMIDVNIKGTLYGIDAVLPMMRKQKFGQIINIASVAGHAVSIGSSVYSATKFAVRAISEGLRKEEAAAKSNIRITVISPGAIATELTDHVKDPETKANLDKFYADYAVSADRVASAIAYAIDAPADTAMNEIVIRPTSQQ